MKIINVIEPESGLNRELKVQPVNNFAFPGWVVLIPGHRNIFLYRQNGEWHMMENRISVAYAHSIGEKLLFNNEQAEERTTTHMPSNT